jgi:hypothetical protein
MKWTTLQFGKYAGLSSPRIILADADWFFWALNEGVFWGKPGEEAVDLAAKAKAIKIPKPDSENWQVEYCFENNGRFVEFGFVKADAPFHGGRVHRLPYLDLSFIGRSRAYDKRGCRYLLRDFRRLYFGEGVRLTKGRCEEFFSNRRNFLKSAKATVRPRIAIYGRFFFSLSSMRLANLKCVAHQFKGGFAVNT